MYKKFNSFLKSPDFKILKYILTLFLGWRLIISFIAFFGISVLPISVGPGQIAWTPYDTDFWLKWANWDGGHFRGIAEKGYIVFQVVFFPLYPLLIKGLMYLKIPSLLGGLLISNLSIVAALYYLYKLIILDFDESIAKKAVIVTLAFPTAFYFGVVYSEALFFFLAISSFYYSRKRNFFLAFILAGLATITRLAGVGVIVAVALEYFLKITKPPTLKIILSSLINRLIIFLFIVSITLKVVENVFLQNDYYFEIGVLEFTLSLVWVWMSLLFLFSLLFFTLRNINYKKIFSRVSFYLLLSFLPLFLYCFYLYSTQGSFFAFVNHENQWQRHLTFPWSAPLIAFRELLKINIFKIGGGAQLLIEFLFFMIFFVMLLISYFKFRISYTLFFIICLLLPISTGTLQAIHRYGLIIFPVFILLAQIKNQSVFYLWLYFSLMLQGVLLVLFINSYWVT